MLADRHAVPGQTLVDRFKQMSPDRFKKKDIFGHRLPLMFLALYPSDSHELSDYSNKTSGAILYSISDLIEYDLYHSDLHRVVNMIFSTWRRYNDRGEDITGVEILGWMVRIPNKFIERIKIGGLSARRNIGQAWDVAREFDDRKINAPDRDLEWTVRTLTRLRDSAARLLEAERLLIRPTEDERAAILDDAYPHRWSHEKQGLKWGECVYWRH